MADWKKTKCGTCVIQRKKPICNSCMEYSHFQPMSNADRIRTMSDEELGKAMFNFILKAASNPDFIMSSHKYTEWLQSEAE